MNLSVGYGFDPEWFACGQSPLCVEVDRLIKSRVSVVVAAGKPGYWNRGGAESVLNRGLDLTRLTGEEAGDDDSTSCTVSVSVARSRCRPVTGRRGAGSTVGCRSRRVSTGARPPQGDWGVLWEHRQLRPALCVDVIEQFDADPDRCGCRRVAIVRIGAVKSGQPVTFRRSGHVGECPVERGATSHLRG